MWIKPLRRKDVISADRRETFINKVFCNIMTIHEVNLRFLRALRARQKEASMVAQIGDVVLDFVANLEPFLLYGSRQHEAKYIVDMERATNPRFRVFAEVFQSSGMRGARARSLSHTHALNRKPSGTRHHVAWSWTGT